MNFQRDFASPAVTVALVFALLTVAGAPVAASAVQDRDERAVHTDDRGVTSQQSTAQNATTTADANDDADESSKSNESNTTQTVSSPTTTPAPTPTTTLTPNPTPDGGIAGETSFEISSLSAPTTVRRGDRISVGATVTNGGASSGAERVNYSFGGAVVATQRVTLDAGESTRVTFRSSLSEIEQRRGSAVPGSYVHGVRNETGDGAAARVRVTPNVDFTVQTFDAPTELSHDEPYIVLATVENPGDTTITRTVAYEFDGSEIGEKTVTVDGGKQRQVAFKIALADVEAAVGPVADGTTHNHGVVTGESRRGGEVRIVEGPSADASTLAVEDLQAENDIRPGEMVSVNMTVRNVGLSDFEGQLSYRLDDAIVATEWVHVPIGQQRTVQFRLSYADVERAAVPLSSRDTTHGVWVGDESLRTRPVTVHASVETPTETPPAATFTPAGSSTPDSSGSASSGDGECRRGFFSECGGTAMDETTLTLVGIATSVLGIVYEMLKSR
ncbi:PH domain-containing protein [Haloprofundus salilacus]|uniref:PH domain-containing protein n=1 Tax=Haloprofundus salilacus TaxID=2876190 RepID=UPI001CCC64AE|nr:PH domain-containing protein [Haloprofundus salilacus]